MLEEAGVDVGGWQTRGMPPADWPSFGSVQKTSGEFRAAYDSFAAKCVGVLAILVLFVFLGDLRSPLIVGLAIPVSIVITFGLLYFGNVKLNLMSLGGLSLAAGMLVDNSIVVLENINRHLARIRPRKDGDGEGATTLARISENRRRIATAVYEGAREVARPVIAATLTTIAVFFPVVWAPPLTFVR